MKVVVDANVALSGLLWEGICNQLLRYLIKYKINLLASRATIQEFADVIRYKKFKSRLLQLNFRPDEVIASYENLVSLVSITSQYNGKIEDADDIKFLDVALSGKASLVISGDSHLLKLKIVDKIPMVNPHEAVEVILRLIGKSVISKNS